MQVYKQASFTAVTIDNASSNIAAGQLLVEENLLNVHGLIRCADHVINLIVQAGLAECKLLPNDNDEEESFGTALFESAADPCTFLPLHKLRKLVQLVRRSPARTVAFARTSEYYNLPPLQLIGDSRTRWNSTRDMLERCIHMRKAIDGFIHDQPDLSHLHLLSAEWDLLLAVMQFLDPFKTLTLAMSSEYRPSASQYIGVMQSIQLHIQQTLARDFNSPLADVVRACRTKFEKYSAIIYSNETLLLASLLDPRIKTLQHGTISVQAEYLIRACLQLTESPEPTPDMLSEPAVEISSFVPWLLQLERPSPIADVRTQVWTYLRAPRTKEPDILGWWAISKSDYPALAELARVRLCVQATSCDVERTFSAAGNIISDDRSRLTAEMCGVLVCLADWEDSL